MIWYDMMWYDVVWCCMMWYDVVWYDMYSMMGLGQRPRFQTYSKMTEELHKPVANRPAKLGDTMRYPKSQKDHVDWGYCTSFSDTTLIIPNCHMMGLTLWESNMACWKIHYSWRWFSYLETPIYRGFPCLPCLMKPEGIQFRFSDISARNAPPWISRLRAGGSSWERTGV